MNVSSCGRAPLPVKTDDSVVAPQTRSQGLFPTRKQYLPQSKLGSSIKRYYHRQDDIHQRTVSYTPASIFYSNSRLNKKKYLRPFRAKATGQTGNLRGHMLIHSEEKPYKCQQCDKCFRHKTSVARHQSVHTSLKPYKCQQCDKRFSQKNSLTRHQSTHTGLKPYKCQLCDKCFTRKGSLARHQSIHGGVRPYECGQCDKCFVQKSDLTRHQSIHSDEKPYECDHCGKCFARKNYLKNHLRVHTGAKPYKCRYCYKRFAQTSALTRHRRIHTRGSLTSVIDATTPFPSETARIFAQQNIGKPPIVVS